jgi:nitroreductase
MDTLAMTHPTLDLIRTRRSVNHFDTQRGLSDAQVQALVDDAHHAPSAYNFQNWRFIAVRSAEARQRLKAAAYGQQKVADAPVTFIVVGRLNAHRRLPQVLKASVAPGLLDAATYDAWVGMAAGSHEGNPGLQRDEAFRSAALAAMTLMIGAEARGLVTGPMSGFDPAAVSQAFGLGPDEVPVMLVTVGYPAPGNWPHKPRLPVDELLSVA